MSSDRVRVSAGRTFGLETFRVVWLVLGWAALAVVVHIGYLVAILPTVDQSIVFFLAGKVGQGAVMVEIDALPAAIISSLLLVIGAGGAAVSFALYRAGRRSAHAIAVLALALIAGSVVVTVGGIIAGVVRPQIVEPGLWGGLPIIAGAVVFLSQLLLLIGNGRGKHARLTD